MNFLRSNILKKLAVPIAAAMLFVSSLSSCALFGGDPNDKKVTYEIAEDKKSVTIFASADSRAFSKWSVQLEDDTVVALSDNQWEDEGLFRANVSKTVTGLKAGETYLAFYIPSSKQEYTTIFGYNISVDPLGQITVEVAKSDSQLGFESME